MRSLWLVLLCSLLIFSCKKEKKDQPQQTQTITVEKVDTISLKDELITYPTVNVSVSKPMNFYFRSPIVDKDKIGTTHPNNPFTFEPTVKGSAVWITRNKLRFVPEEQLQIDKDYTCTINGSKLYNDQTLDVSNTTVSFHTALQEVAHFDGDFKPVKNSVNRVKFQGSISFSQMVPLTQLQKDLTITLDGTKLSCTLKKLTDKKYSIISPSVSRTSVAKNLQVSLPKKYNPAGKTWKKMVILPEARTFKVMSHAETGSGDSKSYSFLMSDEIKADYDLSGFVKVYPKTKCKVKTKGKKLTLTGKFKYNTEYRVTIRKNLPSNYGTRMRYDYSATFTPNNIKPKLEFLSGGLFLPTDNNFKVQFRSVNVKKAHIQVYEILPQNIGFFLQDNRLEPEDQRNIFYNLNRVAKKVYNDTIKIDTKKNRWRKTELDLSKYMKGKTGAAFAIQVKFDRYCLTGKVVEKRYNSSKSTLYYEDDGYYSSPANWGYYYENGTKQKLLFNSNIALTMKEHQGGTTVYATHIQTAKPLANLKLDVYSYLNEKIESATTDKNGTITFSNQKLWDKENANYIMAKDESGYALIKISHSTLPMNSFDVSGIVEDTKGTSVYTYTDRGVHRPGDTVFLSSIIRLNKKIPSAKMSAKYRVSNPNGQVIFEKSVKCGSNGHVSVAIPTEMSAPTGNYSARLTIGGSTFYHNLKIETVKPNRLKIEVDIADTLYGSEIGGAIETKYLFGTPAANLKAFGSVTLNPRNFSAKEYPTYTFSSPLQTFSQRSVTLFNRKLDAEGKLDFTADLPNKSVIPSLLSASGVVRIYEKGGSFTKKNFKTIVAPYSHMVGIHNAFGWRSAAIGQEYKIPFVSVDMNGTPIENRRVSVKVYLNKEHWWWHYDSSRDRDFKNMSSTYLIDQKEYISEADAMDHIFEVSDYGQHYVEVTDIESGHTAGYYFWASRWGSAQNNNKQKDQNLLKLSLNKKKYSPTDKATITFDAPKGSIALITLEQSNRIYHTQWVEEKNGIIIGHVPLSAEILPNGYISVSLIQPHKNENDLPIRLFSVVPVFVEEPSTRMKLDLKTPKEIRPNEKFTIEVSSDKVNKDGTYTIAIVDEGLLSLTNFKTPNPWNHYFKKRGLSVRTKDNFDEFIDALLPDMDKLIALGGDDYFKAKKKSKRVDKNKTQRFKPVVMFSKPISIKAGETKKTTFTMPNYVGAVRVMVVGAADHSYNSVAETVPVKQPLMLLTTLPRVVRPKDTIAIPVSVFSMDDKIDSVSVSIKTKGSLKIQGAKYKKLVFKKPSEKDVTFKAAVDNIIGADTIIITAVSRGEKAADTTFLPILSSTPFITDVVDTMINNTTPVSLSVTKLGYEGTNSATLQISRMPDIQLSKRISDLIRYPYGCIEQTTSSTFPQIFLERISDLKPHQKKMATDNVNKGIERLSTFQISSGFSYWPANRYNSQKPNKWGTLYMGHMLVEAKAAGYHIPPSMFAHWKKTVKSIAASYSTKDYRYRTYAMFLLAHLGEAPIGKMNYIRENSLNRLDPLSAQFLATAYYLHGKKSIAKSIEENASYEFTSERELSGTYGSGLRDLSMSAYLAVLREDKMLAAKLISQVADKFSPRGWYSTQETAVAVLAIASYYKQFDVTSSEVVVNVKVNGKNQKLVVKKPQYKLDMNEHWGKTVEVSTPSESAVFVTLLREAVPVKDEIVSENKGMVLTRSFYNEQGRKISLSSVKQSTPFWMVFSVKSKWNTRLDEIALSAMIPSGWEIINLRLTGEKYPKWLGSITEGEYMDIRDDRINWFFDIYSYSSKKFAVKINPSFVGSYKLPAVSVEAMYSPDYYSRIASSPCKVSP